MIIDGQTIEVYISNNAKYYFHKFGHLKQGVTIKVSPFDLPINSNKSVLAECDECKTVFSRSYQQLNRYPKHLCNSCNRKSVGDSNRIKQKTNGSWGFGKSGENHPRWNPNKNDLQLYRNEVRHYTENQPLHLLENFDKPRGLCGVDGAYQLDHKVSIKYGFEHKIPARVIGDLSNLRFIPWQENNQKRTTNHGEIYLNAFTMITK